MHRTLATRWRILAALSFVVVLSALGLASPGAWWQRPPPATADGGPTIITVPDAERHVGYYASLALDENGNPVVSYFDATNDDLKLLHCNDPNCSGGDESITAPDTIGFVGRYTSLVLDASGNPVVSYRNSSAGSLSVLHCNDPNCAGGDESITSPDTTGIVGVYTSLALDAAGNPLVSYYDARNHDLKLLHCNDPNCAGGDESVTSPDTTGRVGLHTSLALDAVGNPVVSYYDETNHALKVMHCNDVTCVGGDESVIAVDTTGDTPGAVYDNSLALDTNGNPVISYFSSNNSTGSLRLLRCNDPNCAGDDESITTPDTGFVGSYSSLELDSSGNPIVSYNASQNSLRLLHCNDPNCSGSDESITKPDVPGGIGAQYTSLALDSGGNPVVSYFYTGSNNLKLLHCGDANCSKAYPTPTPCPLGKVPSAEGCGTPTASPTPTSTATPGGPAMSLRIDAAECDNSLQPTECNVGVGEKFVLSARADVVPVQGYLAFEAFILFGSYGPNASEDDAGPGSCSDGLDNSDPERDGGGDGIDHHDADCTRTPLTYNPDPPEEGSSTNEVVWPDNAFALRAWPLAATEYLPGASEDGGLPGTCSDGINNSVGLEEDSSRDEADGDCNEAIGIPWAAVHGALAGLVPPIPVSSFTGSLVELSLTCSQEPSSTEVLLLTEDHPLAEGRATQMIDGMGVRWVPSTRNLTVNCVAPVAVGGVALDGELAPLGALETGEQPNRDWRFWITGALVALLGVVLVSAIVSGRLRSRS
ncbi:MAG: hypothetical protein IH865_07900 [Chloroflexi bacterium]|nr:hypothetical protein [Chloroflexota bacterium]